MKTPKKPKETGRAALPGMDGVLADLDHIKTVLNEWAEPEKPTRPAGPRPSRGDLVRLYVMENRAVRDVAALLGTSKDMVHRRLKEYGIRVRPNKARSKLRTIPLQELKAAIRAKGITGTARDLGVDEGTVRHQLKVRGVGPLRRRRPKAMTNKAGIGKGVA